MHIDVSLAVTDFRRLDQRWQTVRDMEFSQGPTEKDTKLHLRPILVRSPELLVKNRCQLPAQYRALAEGLIARISQQLSQRVGLLPVPVIGDAHITHERLRIVFRRERPGEDQPDDHEQRCHQQWNAIQLGRHTVKSSGGWRLLRGR